MRQAERPGKACTFLVAQHCVKVLDDSQAVTPKVQAGAAVAHPIVNDIIGALAVEWGTWVSIRHDNLRQGHAVHHRSQLTLILIPAAKIGFDVGECKQ